MVAEVDEELAEILIVKEKAFVFELTTFLCPHGIFNLIFIFLYSNTILRNVLFIVYVVSCQPEVDINIKLEYNFS